MAAGPPAHIACAASTSRRARDLIHSPSPGHPSAQTMPVPIARSDAPSPSASIVRRTRTARAPSIWNNGDGAGNSSSSSHARSRRNSASRSGKWLPKSVPKQNGAIPAPSRWTRSKQSPLPLSPIRQCRTGPPSTTHVFDRRGRKSARCSASSPQRQMTEGSSARDQSSRAPGARLPGSSAKVKPPARGEFGARRRQDGFAHPRRARFARRRLGIARRAAE